MSTAYCSILRASVTCTPLWYVSKGGAFGQPRKITSEAPIAKATSSETCKPSSVQPAQSHGLATGADWASARINGQADRCRLIGGRAARRGVVGGRADRCRLVEVERPGRAWPGGPADRCRLIGGRAARRGRPYQLTDRSNSSGCPLALPLLFSWHWKRNSESLA